MNIKHDMENKPRLLYKFESLCPSRLRYIFTTSYLMVFLLRTLKIGSFTYVSSQNFEIQWLTLILYAASYLEFEELLISEYISKFVIYLKSYSYPNADNLFHKDPQSMVRY